MNKYKLFINGQLITIDFFSQWEIKEAEQVGFRFVRCDNTTKGGLLI